MYMNAYIMTPVVIVVSTEIDGVHYMCVIL